MPQQFHNNWASTLQGAIDDTQTTITVITADAAQITDASATNWYYLTIDDETNIEIVRVTAANGGNGQLTVVRGQDGTSGTAFGSGTVVENRVTAGTLDLLQSMPDSHADNAILKADGLDSKKLQTTPLSIDDDGNLSGHGAKINEQTGTTYTLAASDNGKIVTFTNAAAVTCTLPQQSTTTLPEGFQCAIIQRGAGRVSFATEGSDTIESKDSYTALTGQASTGTVILVSAGAPNTWFLLGDLDA